jgi:Cysteine rich repeat
VGDANAFINVSSGAAAVQFPPRPGCTPLAITGGIMKTLAISTLTLALLTAGASAQTRTSLDDVCKFDIQQYCKDIRKTRIRELRECLRKHEKDLFPRCQDNYKEAN